MAGKESRQLQSTKDFIRNFLHINNSREFLVFLFFVLIAFLGVVTTHDLLMMIAFQYGAKLLIESVFGTPMAYATIHALERYILKKEK